MNKVDWEVVYLKKWKNDESDNDRMRRKQAEFLVKNEVPVCCIAGIIAYTEIAKNHIIGLLEEASLALKVVVDEKQKYYY